MIAETLTRCAYCGDICDETHVDSHGEPACHPPCAVYATELARQVEEQREAVEMEGWR